MATPAGKNPAGGPAGTLAGASPAPASEDPSLLELADLCVAGSPLNILLHPFDYARCVFAEPGTSRAPVGGDIEQMRVDAAQTVADISVGIREGFESAADVVKPFALSFAAIGFTLLAFYFVLTKK